MDHYESLIISDINHCYEYQPLSIVISMQNSGKWDDGLQFMECKKWGLLE